MFTALLVYSFKFADFAMETIEKSENNNMNYQYVIFDAWENRVLF